MTDESTPPITVPTIVDDTSDFTVIARNPQEMVGAQKSMILWTARKIQSEKGLLADAQENLDTAAKNKWKTQSWKLRISMSEKKLAFYRKVKTALENGYYIVPPFPIEIFAIRTNAKRPKEKMGYTRISDIPTARPDTLEEGKGKYVSPFHRDRLRTFSKKVPDGYSNEPKQVIYHTPVGFDDIDFPFKLAKSEVMTATSQAMALRVFDQLGILPASSGVITASKTNPDPMILGQILMPHKRNSPLTFFVAWWLDTKTL
jgi:hypothetical protein